MIRQPNNPTTGLHQQQQQHAGNRKLRLILEDRWQAVVQDLVQRREADKLTTNQGLCRTPVHVQGPAEPKSFTVKGPRWVLTGNSRLDCTGTLLGAFYRKAGFLL